MDDYYVHNYRHRHDKVILSLDYYHPCSERGVKEEVDDYSSDEKDEKEYRLLVVVEEVPWWMRMFR